MSPGGLARAELTALIAEIDDVRGRLRQLAAEMGDVDPGPAGQPDRATLALLGVDLHSYYTMVEALIERMVAALEGRTLTGPAMHVELLRHATRALPGIRPSIFAPERRESLDELRRFRHFFRHAYALGLQHTKLRQALDLFPEIHTALDQDLGDFAGFLRGLIVELAKD